MTARGRHYGIRQSLKKAKTAGIPVEKVWESIEAVRRSTAAKDNWRASEVVATLVLDLEAIETVYGKKARRRVEQLRALRAVGVGL